MDENIIVNEIFFNKPQEERGFLTRALQIQPGGYGYGDVLCGTRVPILRKIAKKYSKLSMEETQKLLQNKVHEARFVALVILVKKFKNHPDEVFDTYLKNTKFVNNWDLVDISAHHIVGTYSLIHNDLSIIKKLANSQNLWDNRIAIVATWQFIKYYIFQATFDLSEQFIHHPHHLIHKACGWMLREVGKRDPLQLVEFIDSHPAMPTIMKRYALEKLKNQKEH